MKNEVNGPFKNKGKPETNHSVNTE